MEVLQVIKFVELYYNFKKKIIYHKSKFSRLLRLASGYRFSCIGVPIGLSTGVETNE